MTARTVVRGGYGIYYDEIFQNITLYERWTDVRTPLNFLTFSPTPWTPAFFAANRDSIRESFIDPTFAGQIMRLTAPDLVQPWAHHFNVGGSHQVTPPSRWMWTTSIQSGRTRSTGGRSTGPRT